MMGSVAIQVVFLRQVARTFLSVLAFADRNVCAT